MIEECFYLERCTLGISNFSSAKLKSNYVKKGIRLCLTEITIVTKWAISTLAFLFRVLLNFWILTVVTIFLLSDLNFGKTCPSVVLWELSLILLGSLRMVRLLLNCCSSRWRKGAVLLVKSCLIEFVMNCFPTVDRFQIYCNRADLVYGYPIASTERRLIAKKHPLWKCHLGSIMSLV